MKFVTRSLLFVSLFFSFLAQADLSGTWQGKEYRISLSDTFDYIRGNWGDTDFDLRVSETFQTIDGKIAQQDVDLDVSSTFSTVRGKVPCGTVDYRYSVTFENVSGTLCDQPFEIRLNEPEEVIPTAQGVMMDEILVYFPAPARGAVSNFILTRIHF